MSGAIEKYLSEQTRARIPAFNLRGVGAGRVHESLAVPWPPGTPSTILRGAVDPYH